MKIVPHAEIFTPDHPLYKAYLDGFKKTPGHLLADVLRENQGRYQVTSVLPDRVINEAQASGSEVTDPLTLSILRTKTIDISLEHLRGNDPETTRIIYGARVFPDHPGEEPGGSSGG